MLFRFQDFLLSLNYLLGVGREEQLEDATFRLGNLVRGVEARDALKKMRAK